MGGFNISGVAVVTGAASGIGREIALTFASEGASAVIFADINLQGAQQAAEESREIATYGNRRGRGEFRAMAVGVDVGDLESVRKLVEKVVEECGRVDYCVNCAGLSPQTANTIPSASPSDLERLHRVHVVGTLNVIQEVGKIMKAQAPISVHHSRSGTLRAGNIRGTIVNVGSMFGVCVSMGQMPYTVTNHALVGLSKNAALDLAPHGIRINTLLPGWVDTPMTSSVPPLAAARIKTSVETHVPIGRMATAEEIADVAIFLASPRSSYMYGSSVTVDGGLLLGPHRNRGFGGVGGGKIGGEDEGDGEGSVYSW